MDPAANVLTITERPYSLWFSGAMFFGFGLMMILQGESSAVMGTIFLLIGLFLLVNSPITTASLDRSRNLLVLHSRAFIRKRSQEIPFMDVADIEVQHSRGRRGSSSYRLAFVLRDNSIIPMTSYYSSGRASKIRQAEQMRQFLNLESEHDQASPRLNTSMPSVQTAFTPVQNGETRGVSWQIERAAINNMAITRWSSAASGLRDGFLLLIQQPPKGLKIPAGLLGGLSELAYRYLLQLYGFHTDQLPGYEAAGALEPPVPGLEPHFSATTAQPEAARRLLSAWVILPLRRWAEQNPLQAGGAPMQLVALFYPGGTELAVMNLPPDQQQSLVDLGVDLVRESQGSLNRPNQADQP